MSDASASTINGKFRKSGGQNFRLSQHGARFVPSEIAGPQNIPYNLERQAQIARSDRLHFVHRANNDLKALIHGNPSFDGNTNQQRTQKIRRKHKNKQKLQHTKNVNGSLGVEICIHNISAELQKHPVMNITDYPQKNEAMAKVIVRFKEDPESAGFLDLTTILTAEEKDIERKKKTFKGKIKPAQAEWIAERLRIIRTSQDALGKMITGQKMTQDDLLAVTVNEYVRDELEIMEDGQKTALKEKGQNQNILETANAAISVYQVFYDKTFNYGNNNFEEDEE